MMWLFINATLNLRKKNITDLVFLFQFHKLQIFEEHSTVNKIIFFSVKWKFNADDIF